MNLQRVLQSESILARFLPAALREKKAYQNKTSFIEDIPEPQSTSAPNFIMRENHCIDEMDPLIPIDKKHELKQGNFSKKLDFSTKNNFQKKLTNEKAKEAST